MKARYLFFIPLFIVGCADKKVIIEKSKITFKQNKIVKKQEIMATSQSINDLTTIDQNISAYLSSVKQERYISSLESFEKDYFLPWNLQKIDITLRDAQWAYKAFNEKNSFGANLQKLPKSFFDDIYMRSNFKEFATLNKRAITLKALDIRAFPTQEPLFMNPQKAGEGFPFDYLQNSSIAANKPLLISHYSKDKEWAFVESSFAFGWVKADGIVSIPKKYTELYKAAQKEFCVKEGVAIYDQDKNFLFRSRIGMLLPEINESKTSYKVLTISNYKINQAYYRESQLSKDIVHQGILKFSRENIIKIFNEVSNVKYGWGGMYGQRDCSSTLRDFYAPFGIWLPRNSYKQSQVGKVISLKGLSDDEKIRIIKEKAIPFETLLYKKGHILLYVGVKNDTVVVFHNVWGIKTKKEGKEGRFVIGKPIFSSLKVGSNLQDYDKNASILSHLQSMNIITQH